MHCSLCEGMNRTLAHCPHLTTCLAVKGPSEAFLSGHCDPVPSPGPPYTQQKDGGALYDSERRQSMFMCDLICVPGAGPRDSLHVTSVSVMCPCNPWESFHWDHCFPFYSYIIVIMEAQNQHLRHLHSV